MNTEPAFPMVTMTMAMRSLMRMEKFFRVEWQAR